MEWLNGPWVVGIGGGVLSGILVSAIFRLFFSGKDSREYVQKLQSANREIIYALRPGIAEGHVPDWQAVQSLINATARKYAVDQSDLYDPTQIGEELTKEIMDSSFISANTKQEYCNQLDSLSPIPPLEEKEEAVKYGRAGKPRPPLQVKEETVGYSRAEKPIPPLEEKGEAVEYRAEKPRPDLAEYRSRMVWTMSMMIGVMTAIMTMAVVFFNFPKGDTIDLKFGSIQLLLPTIVAFITLFMMGMLMLFRNEYQRLARRREEAKENGHQETSEETR